MSIHINVQAASSRAYWRNERSIATASRVARWHYLYHCFNGVLMINSYWIRKVPHSNVAQNKTDCHTPISVRNLGLNKFPLHLEPWHCSQRYNALTSVHYESIDLAMSPCCADKFDWLTKMTLCLRAEGDACWETQITFWSLLNQPELWTNQGTL